MMKISKTLINTLLQLMDGESVASSTLRKDFAETLLAEGLLTVQTHGSRRAFKAIDTIALKNFLQTHYEELRTLGDNDFDSYTARSEQAIETGNSKLVMVRSCPGFPVNSYEPITCLLSGKDFVINPPEGCFLFIDNWQQFIIPEDVVVVGIENMESFRMIRHQRKSAAVCLPLSAIERSTKMAARNNQPLCTFRRFRFGRYSYLFNRVSSLSWQ